MRLRGTVDLKYGFGLVMVISRAMTLQDKTKPDSDLWWRDIGTVKATVAQKQYHSAGVIWEPSELQRQDLRWQGKATAVK